MKNQSGTIKTNLELDSLVMGGSGGYRRLPGESDDFSLQTDTHHNIYIVVWLSQLWGRIIRRGKWEICCTHQSVNTKREAKGRIKDKKISADGNWNVRGRSGAEIVVVENIKVITDDRIISAKREGADWVIIDVYF